MREGPGSKISVRRSRSDRRAPSQTRVVGRPYTKVDGPAKVTGQTRFADDVMLPRMLHCKLLRSKIAHAKIVSIDVSKALAMPGVAFLSGGQSDEAATAHLNAMNQMGPLPWKLTFSYGRALQHAPQKAWAGRPENVTAAQRAFAHRARMNGLASLGQWEGALEKAA